MDFNVENEGDDLEFLSLRQQMKDDGEAAFAFDRVTHSHTAGSTGDGEVITLVNTDNQTAVAVWVTPYPEAQFEQDPRQTDGARLGRALARCWPGESNEDTFVKANESGGNLTVTKNEFGDDGQWGWLWQVTPQE